jgi:hypothetical protein
MHYMETILLDSRQEDKRFACGSVWVWNSICDIKGETQTEGVWEQGVEENIWTEVRWSDEVGENYIMRSFIACTLFQV